MKSIIKWLRTHSSNIVNSIAFYPAIIACIFLLLSWAMLEMDFSTFGKELKGTLDWLSLRDASTARTIVSTILAGLISLTVFSFSMVMIVLNQAASQMSNRILNSMIENRFQQFVLGFYIGTIVYALFLLSTIRDTNTGIYVPALSIYLLIIFTVINIFLFIYFLDYVTKTVKFETIIRRVKESTLDGMKNVFIAEKEEKINCEKLPKMEIASQTSGYFQGFERGRMVEIAKENDIIIDFVHEIGTYILEGCIICNVYNQNSVNNTLKNEITSLCDFFIGEPINRNPNYGFRHLSEVAIKALSRAINDPATAVLSLNALSELFAFRLHHCRPTVLKDNEGNPRVQLNTLSFSELFELCILPVWDYGRYDRYIQKALLGQIHQLLALTKNENNILMMNKLLIEVRNKIDK
ncbi:DUF2254 domain-containing protein [Arachidicoccus soli]|uniref:DUF2254 domain-containing protein n=1 Tax=Arachidicoccus soli TaxID=2341117 RepID=A0A386HKK3_9BACT|nr:DUF2254 domain-containing protein [Arachidicoccus soli]AYD46255.1 DUF2254 domain-containing protein [Arachidicoccus soli]